MSLFCCSLPSGSYLRIKCTDCKGPSPALGPGVSGGRLCSAPVPSALSPLLLSSYSSPATPLQLLLSSVPASPATGTLTLVSQGFSICSSLCLECSSSRSSQISFHSLQVPTHMSPSQKDIFSWSVFGEKHRNN